MKELADTRMLARERQQKISELSAVSYKFRVSSTWKLNIFF